ncbi:uncharacterized protein LOC113541778 [Pangasianodon hypophthalmus]|uniref:uncharacterized protein LOC113541778 n=1 Tax=Pangasianodon hypophthalmus TaxID=310915 RepID=UPI0023073A50|nr:uncharacterized protein LOC113541778 [Pangasianodon hypophthalmus]XP_053096161.1 uncharacterized protein LOC113541778 [Pangasianodon hypophthalmus]
MAPSMLIYSISSMTNAFNIHLRPCLRCLILLLPCLFLLLVCFWCCRSGIGAGFRFGLGLGRCCWLLSTQPGPRGLGLLPAWAAAERTKELSLCVCVCACVCVCERERERESKRERERERERGLGERTWRTQRDGLILTAQAHATSCCPLPVLSLKQSPSCSTGPKQPAPAHSHCSIHGTMKYRCVLSLVSGQRWPAFASLNIQVCFSSCMCSHVLPRYVCYYVFAFTCVRVSVGACARMWKGCIKNVEPRAKPGIARGSACYVGRLASWTPVEYQRRVHATPSHSPPALREREREREREKEGEGCRKLPGSVQTHFPASRPINQYHNPCWTLPHH